MILFLIDKVSSRWEYTFEFIFGLRGIKYQLTDDVKIFAQSSNLKYEVPFQFGRLLSSVEIQAELQEEDLLSRLFFVLSRMEEYNAQNLDKHKRFSARDSWQFKNDCLDQCVCDRWAIEFIQFIEKEVGTSFLLEEPEIKIIPTFDIDNAYAFKHKAGKRRFLSLAKDVFTRNLSRIKERNKVLKGLIPDPYDSYEVIFDVAKINRDVRLFFLVGDYGNEDYNIAIEQAEIKKLVNDLKEKMKVGIHPSYRSNSNKSYLINEINRLEKAINSKVSISRQHFLKLSFPSTYHGLVENGIQQDYTMGYADAVGFRNGTAHPFPWFDLTKNQITGLTVFPFAYMDGTLNEYLNLSVAESKEKIKTLFDEVKQYGGQFSFIWHNETISNYGIWKGWSEVLDYTLQLSSIKKQ